MGSVARWTIIPLAFVAAFASLFAIPAAESQEPDRPKLVVLVVFDQLRGDYPKKWQPLFGDGGFKRLQSDGAWFTNCHYPYAWTVTAPGHTSLSTGADPAKTGIIANEWYDRSIGESVAAVMPPPEEKRRGVGPYRRNAESVGDVLLRVLMGKGRVASLSLKDRSAIFMAALRAQLCYWFNARTGSFKTSAYYRPEPHPWVAKFNSLKVADQWLDKTWDRFDPRLDYVKHSGPDDFADKSAGVNQGRTFPHRFQLGKTEDAEKNKQSFYNAVYNSPMGNDLLLQFTKAAIVNEKLGQGDSVDLLCVSFSSNDPIGHSWGPDSQEVLDVTLRSDALLKDLLGFLDDKVGKDKYYLALCADHGVCPLPELARGKPEYGDPRKVVKEAGRVDPEVLTTRAEEFLNAKYLPAGKKAPWLEPAKKGNPWVYFNHATLKELKLAQADVGAALAKWFSAQPGIEQAFTRTQMMTDRKLDAGGAEAELFSSVKRSFHPDRSGDVMVILKPYHLFSPAILTKNPDKRPSAGTSHGTPHDYDTHVPLMVMGPRIIPGNREQRVTPQAMASILAEALGVSAPKDATYPLPAGLFR